MDEGLLKYLLSLQLIETYWMNKIVHELREIWARTSCVDLIDKSVCEEFLHEYDESNPTSAQALFVFLERN